MLYALIVFAQNATDQQTRPWWQEPIIPFMLIGLLFLYFMMILPERRRRKEMQAMLSALKKNDKVLTIGGMIGVVATIHEKEQEITLRVEEGKIRIQRGSIARVLTAEAKPAAEAAKSEPEAAKPASEAIKKS
jgi:preprotein translocase subunit YajC